MAAVFDQALARELHGQELDGLIFRGRGGRPAVDVVAEFP